MIDQPRQRQPQRIGIIKPVDRKIARRTEGMIETLGNAGIGAVHAFADDDHMHHRQDAGAYKVIALDRLEIREQPMDARRACAEARRQVIGQDGIEPAVIERVHQGVTLAEDFDLAVPLRQRLRRRRRLQAAQHPLDLLRPDAEFVAQHSLDEDDAGGVELRRADAFSDQVLRPRDAAAGTDIDARVPEHLRQRHRQADEAPIALGGEAHVRRQ